MRAIIPSVARVARVAAASMRRSSGGGQLIHLGSFRPKRVHSRICTASADANFWIRRGVEPLSRPPLQDHMKIST